MAGFENDVVYGKNADFSGANLPRETNGLISDGQLWIGRTSTNAGGTHVDVGTLTAGTGVSITNGAGTITVSASGTTPVSFPTDSGTATPALNSLSLLGQNVSGSGIQTSGSGSTVSHRMASPYTLGNFFFENPLGTVAKYQLQALNRDTDANSGCEIRAGVTTASNADAWIQVGRNATYNYCWGIDNSDSGTLKICQDANGNSAVPSGGTLLWSMTTAGLSKYEFGQAVAYNAPVSYPATIATTDYYCSVDTSSARTINLPNAGGKLGQVFVVKDRTGNSAINNITVTTPGGTVLIDGSTSFIISSNYAAFSFLWNGTGYEIF